MKKSFTAAVKASVALAALTEKQTLAEISSQYAVHATQVSVWKKQAQQILVDGFADKRRKEFADYTQKIAGLHELIGKRDEELEWLKKKCAPLAT